MNILAVIIARGGSKRVPGKNSRLFRGRPLITYIIDRALATKSIDRVIVSTDSLEIAGIAKSRGVEVPFMRPDELALDDTPARAVIDHALQALCEDYDVVITLQPTSPLILTDDIEGGIELLRSGGYRTVKGVTPVKGHPEWYYKMAYEQTLAPLLCDDDLRKAKSQDLPAYYTLNGAFTIRRLNGGRGTGGYVIPLERALDIDTEEDFE